MPLAIDATFAGIGAVLAGLGSFLSGFGAYKAATRKEKPSEQETSDIPG